MGAARAPARGARRRRAGHTEHDAEAQTAYRTALEALAAAPSGVPRGRCCCVRARSGQALLAQFGDNADRLPSRATRRWWNCCERPRSADHPTPSPQSSRFGFLRLPEGRPRGRRDGTGCAHWPRRARCSTNNPQIATIREQPRPPAAGDRRSQPAPNRFAARRLASDHHTHGRRFRRSGLSLYNPRLTCAMRGATRRKRGNCSTRPTLHRRQAGTACTGRSSAPWPTCTAAAATRPLARARRQPRASATSRRKRRPGMRRRRS